jgi:hypothetical protein
MWVEFEGAMIRALRVLGFMRTLNEAVIKAFDNGQVDYGQ